MAKLGNGTGSEVIAPTGIGKDRFRALTCDLLSSRPLFVYVQLIGPAR